MGGGDTFLSARTITPSEKYLMGWFSVARLFMGGDRQRRDEVTGCRLKVLPRPGPVYGPPSAGSFCFSICEFSIRVSNLWLVCVTVSFLAVWSLLHAIPLLGYWWTEAFSFVRTFQAHPSDLERPAQMEVSFQERSGGLGHYNSTNQRVCSYRCKRC